MLPAPMDPLPSLTAAPRVGGSALHSHRRLPTMRMKCRRWTVDSPGGWRNDDIITGLALQDKLLCHGIVFPLTLMVLAIFLTVSNRPRCSLARPWPRRRSKASTGRSGGWVCVLVRRVGVDVVHVAEESGLEHRDVEAAADPSRQIAADGVGQRASPADPEVVEVAEARLGRVHARAVVGREGRVAPQGEVTLVGLVPLKAEKTTAWLSVCPDALVPRTVPPNFRRLLALTCQSVDTHNVGQLKVPNGAAPFL